MATKHDNKPHYASPQVTFIDLFAGIGGIRLGLEQALQERGYASTCVFTSEVKPHAIKILQQNHEGEVVHGDITKIDAQDIPDFDILCAGFPCQAFSQAGNRNGFADTRGTLFFEVERIVRAKRPKGLILENVEGLVSHDHGNTLKVILGNLRRLDYLVSYAVLNAKNFAVPQDRKRIYIVGISKEAAREETPVALDGFAPQACTLETILEKGMPVSGSKFVRLLLEKYGIDKLIGRSIKDKRGGNDNIHSWDLGLKGPVSDDEKTLLNALMLERRKRKWAQDIGIEWMDGMPLTKNQIQTFFDKPNLQEMLNDLTEKGYLRLEHPKKKIVENVIAANGTTVTVSKRAYDHGKPKGYNIVAGKLSFAVGKILNPKEVAPTLVATDMQRLYVADGKGLRKLTTREGLRLFGYPETQRFDISEREGFDLLGNTVAVPVIKAVATRLIDHLKPIR